VGFLQWRDSAVPPGGPAEDRKPLQMELNPGTVTELDPGLEFAGWDPSQPSGVYSDFTKTVLRRIASGLGLSYSSLSNDLREVNYSSTKVGLQAEREMWRMLQDWWIASFLQPLYVRWLEAATLSGKLVLPSADWRRFAAVKWVPRVALDRAAARGAGERDGAAARADVAAAHPRRAGRELLRRPRGAGPRAGDGRGRGRGD
jgi:lambda family phage portal protein